MKVTSSVTIFIPAHNEAGNIDKLIYSLLNQKSSNFILDNIIVLNDASTDNTADIVMGLSKRYNKLTLVNDDKRQGLRYRIQQMMSLNESDIFVIFDADVIPLNDSVLEELISVFSDNSVQLATAKLMPLPPKKYFEYVNYDWRILWSKIVHSWSDGNNIYNFRGSGIAIRKGFAKAIHLPKDVTSASYSYIFLLAKSKFLKTAFSKNSVIQYQLAASFTDYLNQINRGKDDGYLLRTIFPTVYEKEYLIPPMFKFSQIKQCFIINPSGTVQGLLFNLIMPLLNRGRAQKDINGIWEPIKSTKLLDVHQP